MCKISRESFETGILRFWPPPHFSLDGSLRDGLISLVALGIVPGIQ